MYGSMQCPTSSGRGEGEGEHIDTIGLRMSVRMSVMELAMNEVWV